jgi:hypothetical protein
VEIVQQVDQQWHDLRMRSDASTGNGAHLRIVMS